MKPLRQRRALPIFYRFLLLLCLCGCIIIPSFLHNMKAIADGKQAGKSQSPTANFTIDGTIRYYSTAVPPINPKPATISCLDTSFDAAKPVPGVTVQLTGSPGTSTPSNASGFYSATGLLTGPYTMTPGKASPTPPPPPPPGISSTDATRIQQFLTSQVDLNECQRLAADTTNNGGVASLDATRIQQYLTAIANPGVTGLWKFVPVSKTYLTLTGDVHNENYNAVLVGDVTGNLVPTSPISDFVIAQLKESRTSAPQAPQVTVPVSFPNIFVHPGQTSVLIPINVSNLPANTDVVNRVQAYDALITFNSSVLRPNPANGQGAFSLTGTLSNSSGASVVTNSPASGQLSISVTLPNSTTNTTITSGTLLFLVFDVIGGTGTSSPLNFSFFTFNEGDPVASTTNGSVTVGPTAVDFHHGEISTYEGGTFIEWQTGYEAENLGFNIYRDEGGKRTKINNNLIAGSALKTQSALGAGEGYAWWDEHPDTGASYWIEDIDMDGKSSWHGPFYAKFVGGNPPERSRAALLSNLGNRAKEDNTRVVEDRSFANDSNTFKASGRYALVAGAKNSFASDPSVKISIKDAGWYRVTQPELVAAGLNPNANPATLQLFVDGREIPMSISGNGNVFNSQSAIEFYATALNTQASDSHVYWLVDGNQTGLRIPLSKNDVALTSSRTFVQTVERKDRTLYFSALLNGDAENFFGAVVSPTPVDQTVSLPHLVQAEATMEIALQGVSRTTHRVSAMVNGFVVGEVNFDSQLRGVGSFSVPGSFLRDGSNTVTLLSQNGQQDVSVVDYVRVSYTHSLTADNDYLNFTANGRERVTVDGFLSRDIRVFDVTNLNAVKELTGFVSNSRNRFSVGFTSADTGVRNLVATTQAQSKHAVNIAANQPSNWRATNSVADLVIIAKGDLLSAIEPLKVARQQEGYRVAVVDVEDVYDEFNSGNKSPQAIKDFLSYARSNWSVAPRFVLFVGDATFDPKDYLGFGAYDGVPTKLVDTTVLETASDDWFADFNNDGIADIPVGRLPVRNATEANAVISKLTQSRISTGSSTALLVSDLPDSFNFEQQNTNLRSTLSTYQVSEIRRRELGDDQARAQLLAALNSGPRIVNYYGHGSINLLRGNLLNTTDAANLTNNGSLSFFTLMDCLNGYFHDVTGDSLAEALLKANNGGALAVWTSSGLTFPDEQSRMNQQLYSQLFGELRGKITLGEAIQQAKTATTDTDVRRTWTLLGDPTTRIK